jgi:uncharacterized protein
MEAFLMSTIAIIGGTGYVGGHIATEALGCGHQVIWVSRNARPTREVRTGSIEDEALTSQLFADAEARSQPGLARARTAGRGVNAR